MKHVDDAKNRMKIENSRTHNNKHHHRKYRRYNLLWRDTPPTPLSTISLPCKIYLLFTLKQHADADDIRFFLILHRLHTWERNSTSSDQRFFTILRMSVSSVGWKWSNANESWNIYTANLLNLLPSNKKHWKEEKLRKKQEEKNYILLSKNL